MTLRRPSLVLAFAIGAVVALIGAVALYAAGLPSLGIEVSAVGEELLLDRVSGPQPADGPSVGLPARLTGVSSEADPTTVIKVSSRTHLVGRPETEIRQADLSNQDLLRAMASEGSVRLWLQDKNGASAAIDRGVLGTRPPAAFWIIVLTGLFGAVIGLWLLVMRSRELAAQAAGLAGLALLGAALPMAVAYSAEFIVGGRLFALLLNLNSVAGQVFGAAFLCLFLSYPVRLLPARVILAACSALGLAVLPVVMFVPTLAERSQLMGALVGLDLALMIVALVLQWRRTRDQPLGRAYLRLVGSVTTLSLGCWVAFFQVPSAAGLSPLIDVSYGFLLTLAPFAAIAFGIARGHLFDLDRWASRLLGSALILLGLLTADLILVFGIGLAPGPAASGSLLLVGTLWLIARNRALEVFLGRRRIGPLQLCSDAVHIALAPSAAQRFERWRLTLTDLFEPLEMVAAPAVRDEVAIQDGGRSLLVPAPEFGHALVLRGARQGRSLFRREDCETVTSLLLVCRQIESGRESYDRGIREERHRIARDLHDDVSARLLTSLHRTDSNEVRTDVRAAISDIRTIVSGLEGRERQLGELLGSLRHDARERLEAANIGCRWEVDDRVAGMASPVSYRVYKALTSAMREAVTNVIRHSQAACVEVGVRLSREDQSDWLGVTLADDGVGISADARRGHGARNMADRIRALGGSVEYGSGAGTTIVMAVPLERLPPDQGDGDGPAPDYDAPVNRLRA